MVEHNKTSRNTSAGKGSHPMLGWADPVDEAARNALTQVIDDRGIVVFQTAGISPGFYAALGVTGSWVRLDNGVGSVSHASTTGQTANDHHSQQHALGGADHTGVIGDIDGYTKSEVDVLVDATMKAPEAFAPSGTYPVTYEGNAVQKGDSFRITAAGTVGAVTVNIEDLLIAIVDTPAQTDANWMVAESNRDQATETVKGVAELATQAEADAGTNDTNIITALKMASAPVNVHTHDHGDLTGLGDDDHTQYLKADGTRALSGNMAVSSLVTIDGRDLSVDGSKLDGIEAGAKDDQSAAEVAFTPDGDIAATDVQAAIVEVRDDTDTKLSGKAPTAHNHDAGDLTTGTLVDARVAESNVTQHEAAIDHDALLNHDVDQHREIDDSSTSITGLWSSSKIDAEVTAASADTTLAEAHAAGNAIAVTAANGPVDLSNAVDATTLLNLVLAGAFGHDAIVVTMDADSTGFGLRINQNATDGVASDAIRIIMDAAAGGQGLEIQHGGLSGGDLLQMSNSAGVLFRVGVDGTILITGNNDADVDVKSEGTGNATFGAQGSGNLQLFSVSGDSILESVGGEVQLSHLGGTSRVKGDLLIDGDFDAGELTTGTLADARVAESNVTQHEAAIDHDALANFEVGEHRVINDAGTGTTDLLSADKILSEISTLLSGSIRKPGVDTTTTSLGNTTLSGEQTLNGVTTLLSLVLVTEQTLPAENGPYVTAAGAWTRAVFADEDVEVSNGNLIDVINEASDEFQYKYLLVTPDPIVVGTTGQTWQGHRNIELGTTGGTAAEGNDSRIPSQDENDALVGTSGTPSSSNEFVTNADPRNSDARTPTAHTHTHASTTGQTADDHHNQQHALAGADHTSATLAELNAKVSDATLDDSGDARLPTTHALAGSEHSASTLAQLNALVSDATLDDSGDARPPTAHNHDASDLTTGTLVDARVQQSNVTQHVAAIDHDALLNFAIGEHRVINDAGTSAIELWSAQKIDAVTTPSENAILMMRRTTTFAFPVSWGDVTMDTTVEETDTAVLEHVPGGANPERMVFQRAGNYLVSYALVGDQPSSDNLESRLNHSVDGPILGSADQAGPDTHNQLHTFNLGRTVVVEIDTPGDYITLQVQNADTGGTVKAGAILTATALTGKTGAAGPTGPTGGPFPEIQVFADMFEAVNADWPITVVAPTVKLAGTSRMEVSFDDSTETAVGWQFEVPVAAVNATLELISRAQTGPAGAEVARYNVRESGSPDDAADTAFSSPFQFPDIDIPSGSTNRQYDSVTRTLAEWGFTAGEVHQICLSRDTGDAADTLTGNLLLLGAFWRFTS